VQSYLASGQLSILTVDDAYMREGIFDPDRMIALLRTETERALAEGYSALRVTGEMTWALRGLPGSERLIEYETRLNEFFPGSKCLAICQYDRRRFDPAVLLEVLRTHPIAVVGTEVYDNLYYIPPAGLLGGDLPAAELRHWAQNLAEHKRKEQVLHDNIQRMEIAYQQATIYARELRGEIAERKRAEKTLKRRLEQLAGLNQASQAMTASLKLDQVLAKIVSLAGEVMASDYASVVLVDEEGRLGQSAEDLPGVPAIERRIRAEGFTHWIARSRQAAVVDDIDEDGTVNPRPTNGAPYTANPLVVEAGVKSFVGLPLVAKGRLQGVLYLHSPRPGNFRDQLPLVTTFANQAAVAIENARLYSQLESRQRFITRILESIPSSLVAIDRALRIVSANRNFLVKTRREAQATLGRKIEEVFPQVLVQSTRLDQKVQQVFHTGHSEEGAKVAYRAPGVPTRIYYYRLVPLKVGEAVENVMLLMDDITEQEQLGEEVRRAERHLASVVECANDLVVSMDPQGRIVTWNQAAERAAGLKADQVKGQSLVSLCAAEQRPAMEEMSRKLARGESVQNAEGNLLTGDGQEVPVAWSCSSMRDDTGEVVGLVAVGRDLTERRQLETQLIHSAKMASLGGMAGGIAHEVRNPLGIISASAQLLLEHPDDAQLRSQCAQKIHAATQRTSQIIENLLKFARPQSERMREVDLHAVLEDTVTLLAPQMTLQKVTLRKEFQPNLPRVYGNPNLLLQVFTNLILNACKAMPQGGTLTVATRAIEAEQVEIQFSDTGCGIPPENTQRIFDPFFTTMPVGEGIGLGLSISYSIIQQHQGTIEVKSQVGKGSTFTVRLPVNSR
jgi:PAS domain S-box-containing protein